MESWVGTGTGAMALSYFHLDIRKIKGLDLAFCLPGPQPRPTLFLDDGDVYQAATEGGSAHRNIDGLHQQLLLIIILRADEEGHSHIHQLYTLLELHHAPGI